MKRQPKEWYFAWRPGIAGYDRDDIIVAVGLQCRAARFRYEEVISWIGTPCKASGDRRAGHIVYYFDGQVETAAIFDVMEGRVIEFGTIIRTGYNAKRMDEATGKTTGFNVLDEMEDFQNSAFSKDPSPSP